MKIFDRYILKSGVVMTLLLKIIILTVLTIHNALANGGATALDEIILHKKEGIKKARTAREKEKLSTDLDKIFSEMIETQKKEVAQLKEMKRKLFPKVHESKKDFSQKEKDLKKDFDELQDEMDRIISKFKYQFQKIETISLGYPKIEIKEDSKNYDIIAEVPGIMAKNMKVQVKENSLVIEGERLEETNKQGQDISTTDINYGEFKRSIPLDHKVNPATLKTENKNGLLIIHVEKI